MAQYRKKPVVIEAEQLTWANWDNLCAFLGEDFFKANGRGTFLDKQGNPTEQNMTDRMGLIIPTLEGEMVASENDYIIRGVKGELYPCKPDIFAATYDAVDSL